MRVTKRNMPRGPKTNSLGSLQNNECCIIHMFQSTMAFSYLNFSSCSQLEYLAQMERDAHKLEDCTLKRKMKEAKDVETKMET